MTIAAGVICFWMNHRLHPNAVCVSLKRQQNRASSVVGEARLFFNAPNRLSAAKPGHPRLSLRPDKTSCDRFSL